MDSEIIPFDPKPTDLTVEGFGPFPLEGRVKALLEQADADGQWQPTGADRELYLDISERIVCMAIDWVNEEGAVIDPVTGKEWQQTTPRFVSSAAVLISFGRCLEYLDVVCRSMAYACRRLRDGSARDMSPDFWLRELMTADRCLEGIAPPELQQAWRKDLAAIISEETYIIVDPLHGEKLKELHNWAVYSAAGEGLRELAGLGPDGRDYVWGSEFYDIYMKPQLRHMTDSGMYRDPGDPITYDITTRLQFCVPLAYGLETPLRPTLEELQRRGALTALLFTSADGYTPYGGRSSQFQFQEAILCALFELEAQRYRQSDPQLAGAFKTQAHRCALTTARWLMDMTPPRHLKNGFDPQSHHGIDGYGQYSVYLLLCSSFYGLAALFADDTIAEAPAPAQVGGYVIELKDAFHKVFAACGGTYVEIDTRADLHYDATGIGRVHFRGTPLEMVLGMPFSGHPFYKFAEEEEAPDEPVALAPRWWTPSGQQVSLAALEEGTLQSNLDIHEQSRETVSFTLHYQHAETGSQVDETLTLHPDALTLETAVSVAEKPAEDVVYTVPVIVSDGTSTSEVTFGDGVLSVQYLGCQWEIRWDTESVKATLSPDTFANRNARYQLLELNFGTAPVAFTIRNLTADSSH